MSRGQSSSDLCLNYSWKVFVPTLAHSCLIRWMHTLLKMRSRILPLIGGDNSQLWQRHRPAWFPGIGGASAKRCLVVGVGRREQREETSKTTQATHVSHNTSRSFSTWCTTAVRKQQLTKFCSWNDVQNMLDWHNLQVLHNITTGFQGLDIQLNWER